jgi:hypothetical protein
MDRRAFLKGLGGLCGSTSFLPRRLDAFDAAGSPLNRFKLGAIAASMASTTPKQVPLRCSASKIRSPDTGFAYR